MICLLVMTDGRGHLLEQTLLSFDAQVTGPIERRVIHDDSGDAGYRAWLTETFAPDFEIIGGPRAGFDGAIRRAWAYLAGQPERFVFHLEDDFTFNRPVDLGPMASVLDQVPHLAQLALRRQPWNPQERAAGGVVEQHPADYADSDLVGADGRLRPVLLHRRFFTTNPSLYRSSLCLHAWPTGSHSEGRFTHQLLADPELRFGFWGARDSGEAVHHIGDQRVGVGY